MGKPERIDLGNLTEEVLLLPHLVDAALVRICRGQGVVDLALGETLSDLLVGDRLSALGKSCLEHYSVEVLGVSGTNAYFLAKTAHGLRDRPLLRRAVVCGAVSLRKAAIVSSVAKGDAAPAWVQAALTRTEEELTDLVRHSGHVPREIDFETESALYLMTPDEQDRFDRGISLARILIGFGRSRWPAIDALAMEALSSLGGFIPDQGPVRPSEPGSMEEREESRRAYEAWVALWKDHAESVVAQLRVLEQAMEVVEGAECGESPELPLGPRKAAAVLDERARALAAAKGNFDEPFGRLALAAVELDVPRLMRYPNLASYCQDRLWISPRTFRQAVWLERKMRELPEIREALLSGKVNLTKARALAKAANPGNVRERIAASKETTTQETERKAKAERRKRDREAGVMRVWGPKDTLATLKLAIETVTAAAAAAGESFTAGHALAWMGDHFAEVNAEAIKHVLQRVRPDRWEAMMEFAGLCAVPGCPRPAAHLHHIVFRSKGGGDEGANRLPLCARCHLGAVHRGYVEISGRRGKRVVYRLKRGDAILVEEWEIGEQGEARRRDPGVGEGRAGYGDPKRGALSFRVSE